MKKRVKLLKTATKKEENTKLKPCPFCGGKAQIVEYLNRNENKTFKAVMCKDCKIHNAASVFINDDLIETWNTRYKEAE